MYEFESAPLARILELGKIADFDKVTSNCTYFMFFKNNPLPKVPQSTISLIQENHQSKEKMSEILYNISFPFPVITQSISEISRDLDKMSENNKIYSSIFLFYSFFAWFINYTKTGHVYPGDIVLASLLNIRIESSPSYEILAKSAFYFGYKALIESKTIPLFDKYIPTAKAFFLHHIDNESYPDLIPIISGQLFIDILSHFEEPDQIDSETITLSDDLYEIVNIICDSSILHPYIFNEDIISYILFFLKSYMCSKTDIKSVKIIIRCFSDLLKLANNDYTLIISSNLMPGIINLINYSLKESSMKNIASEDHNFNFPENLVTLPSNLEIIQDFTYPETPTFSKGFDKKPLKNITIEKNTQNLFSDLFDNFILSLFYNEKNIKTFVTSILTDFDLCENEDEIKNISFFLLFMLSIINQKENEGLKSPIDFSELIRQIISSLNNKSDVLFNPKITIFQDNKTTFSEELNTIRNEFLMNVNQRKKQMHKFLTDYRLYPLLFTEIIYRLTALNIRIPLSFLDEIMNFYRFMDISNIETNLVEIVRESLFNYISMVYSDSIFDGITIQTSYFLCLMEDNLVDEIIAIFRNYFEKVGTIIDSKSFALFLQLFHMNSINDQSNVIKVMTRFVKLLLSIVQTKISFSRSFKSSYLEILSIISQIKMTEELLQLILTLLISISPECELNDIESFYFKKSILKMYPTSNEITNYESLFASILKLISTDNLHIYNPRVLQAAYILFSSIKFNEFIDDFLYSSLLKSSPHAIENCQKCHLAGFDCFLLDQLFELKNQKYSIQKEQQVNKILSVFELISKYFSSPTAVLKFASLLTPKMDHDNNKVLSRYLPLFMNTLSQLADVDYWKKTKHMKLDEKDEYRGDFIVPKSFSICFWISCRSFDSESDLNIFTANSYKDENGDDDDDEADSNDIKDDIKIYVHENELKIEINGFCSSIKIKKDEWTFITISFTKKAINVYANLILATIISTTKLVNSHFTASNDAETGGGFDDYVSFHGKIGDSSTVSSKEAIELGFFGVLNHQNFEDMKKLYHNGVFSYPVNPIFSYNISNHPKLAGTTTLSDSSFISSNAISVKSIVFNFIFCLTNLWKCDILIPLYSILNVPFEKVETETEQKEVYYRELPYITTHIITKCLIFNPKLQSHFFETNKIRIIAYLLNHMSIAMKPTIIIDLRLYQYFYKMCLCVSNEELHSQIYFTIIANLKLINQTSSEDHLKILENWLSDVHQIPHFGQIGSFSVQLSLMNIFYKYKEINQNKIDLKNIVDVDKIKKEIDDNNNQVSSRREIFHHLLLFSADQSFEMNDYYEIVNQCVELFQKSMNRKSTKDNSIVHNYVKEILDMIRFLNLFIRQSPVAFKNMKININDLIMLNELIINDKNYVNEKICVNLIDTITTFYKHDIINSANISIHLGLIIKILMEASELTIDFFKRLIRHAYKFSPENYLICCWFLSTKEPKNEELQDLFIGSLSSSFGSLPKQTLMDPLYLFWTCILANHLMSEDKLRMFLAFIINIIYDGWHLMLPAIFLFCDSKDSMIMLYLNLVSRILFDKYKNVNYSINDNRKNRNMSLISSRVIRSTSYITPRRRSSLDSFFSTSSTFEVNLSDNENEEENNNNSNNNNNNNEVDENKNKTKTVAFDDIRHFRRRNLSEKDLAVYIQFAIFFILNRPTSIRISTLEKMFVQSPFIEGNYQIGQDENDSSLNIFLAQHNSNNSEKSAIKKESFNYELRFDDDMNWIDLEFAKTIFNMRANLKLHTPSSSSNSASSNQNEVKLFTVLLYFISHVDPNFTETLMNKIKEYQEQKQNSLTVDQMTKSIFIPFDIKKITSDTFVDFYESSFTFLNEIRSNFIQIQNALNNNFITSTNKIDDLSSIQKNVLKESFHSKESIPVIPTSSSSSFTYVDSYENGITKLKRFMLLLEEYDQNKWKELIRVLSIDKCPWSIESSSSSPPSFYYKRSNILCSNFCPFLMKRKQIDGKVKYQKNYAHDYYMNSDFYFWSHNHYLSSFEQASFLDSNLSVSEKQNSDKFAVYDVILQKIDKFISCKLKIGSNSILISQEKVKDDGIKSTPQVISIDKNDILIVMSKIIQNEPEKIELFTSSCAKSYLMVCENSNQIIDSIINICNLRQNQALIVRGDKSLPLNSSDSLYSFVLNLQKKWIEKKCSNFKYLMFLNVLAGRSFNDIERYPIFPWILNEYDKDKINVSDDQIYIQFLDDSKTSSGVLSPSAVSCYLQRVSPFKEISQSSTENDAHFLKGIKEEHELNANSKQRQEITPEFFFMPEFLICNKSDKKVTDDVILPKWCSSPVDFVYLHRKLLESNFISSKLNEWIDLVFGCKQSEVIHSNSEKGQNNDLKPLTVSNLSESLSLMQTKEQLPSKIFTSPHPIHLTSSPTEKSTESEVTSSSIEDETQTHHYVIKSQEGWEVVSYVYFEGDNLYVFDSSSNVSKFSFKFDTFELSFVEKKPLVSSSNGISTKDISFYSEFGFCLKQQNSLLSNETKRKIIAHNNFELNSFSLVEIGHPFTITIKKYYLDILRNKQRQQQQHQQDDKNSIQINSPDKEMTIVKIECSDGQFIVVSYSDELHLSVLEIIDDEIDKEGLEKNEAADFVINRYEQFIAIPKCCAISSIFKTFVVATDDGSMQIASLKGNSPSSRQWSLSKVVDFDQEKNKENIFMPLKILITDSFGFIIVYGKMKLASDENESFIYVFTINGIFIRMQKIDGEVVNWAKWKSKRGFDFLTLVIKKKSIASDENESDSEFNLNSNKSFNISYKIAICEAYYLKLDILKYRFTEKIVNVEFLAEKSLLAIFQSDGNFILTNYDPNDLYIE